MNCKKCDGRVSKREYADDSYGFSGFCWKCLNELINIEDMDKRNEAVERYEKK